MGGADAIIRKKFHQWNCEHYPALGNVAGRRVRFPQAPYDRYADH